MMNPFKQPLLIIGLLSFSLNAQIGVGKNHFKLGWQRFETDHFEIIYHAGLDSVAALSAAIAEQQYVRITETLGIVPASKTSMIIIDTDDISNGLANPLNHSIMIWTPPATKLTTDSLGWLERVIGHEFGHVVTFWGARNVLGAPWELLTLGLTPVWYLEGVAQYSAETWDAHRDLLLRNAFRSRAVLPPHRLEGFMGTDAFGSRLVYEQGHGLVRYISDKYGEEKIGHIIRNHRRMPWSFSRTLKRTVGRSMQALHDDWMEATESAYAQSTREREEAKNIAKKIDGPFSKMAGVRMSAEGRMAAAAEARWDEGVSRLYLRNEGGWKPVGGPHVGGYFAFSPDGESLVYQRLVFGDNGAVLHDLFIWNETAGENRLTHNLRATDPDWSPADYTLCFVKRDAGLSNLWLLDLSDMSLTQVTQFGLGTEVFSPTWSPDGACIAFSMVEPDGRRDIAMIRRDGSGFHKLTDSRTDVRSPAWSADGAWIVYCTYENGAPNLCRIRPDGTNRTLMTNLSGGAFNPAWSPDGTEIMAPVFESRNQVAAYRFPAQRETDRFTPAIRPHWANAAPLQKTPDRREMRLPPGAPYRPLKHIRPLLGLPFFGMDDGGAQIGAFGLAADPLFLHQVFGYATVGRRVHYLVDYQNQQLGANIGVQVSGNTLDRGSFLGSGELPLWERRNALQLNAVIPLFIGPNLMHAHALQLFGSMETIRLHRPGLFTDLKPDFRPFEGRIHQLGIGYAWAWRRPDIASDIHPMGGAFARVLFSVADPVWGAELKRTRISFSVVRRFELPRQRDVLAFRIGGLLQSGDQPIQDRMTLGDANVRALSVTHEGDRFLYGAMEYRFNLIRNLALKLPLLYFERTTAAFWMDAGKAWGRHIFTYETKKRHAFGDTDWMLTSGIELRQRVWMIGRLPLIFRGGVGWDYEAGETNAYFLLGPVF